MRFHACLVGICLVISSLPAAAQEQPHHAKEQARLIISESAIAGALVKEQPDPRDDRDSILNGTLIGAAIGGAAMGAFVTFLCNALQEPSDPSCLGSSMMAIAIGAGAGAAGGAAIDALLARQPRTPVVVRLPLKK
jgi:hypothetical protein